MSQENLAVLAPALALHRRPQSHRCFIQTKSVGQKRYVIDDLPALERAALLDHQQIVRGRVGVQNDTRSVRRQDRRRTTLRQNPQLFLCFAPPLLFRLDLAEMLHRQRVVSQQRLDEQPGSQIGKSGEEEPQREIRRRAGSIEPGSEIRTN